MSSHYEWAEDVIAQHEQNKPFSPENGQPLQFQIGDDVICTNDYGVSFLLKVSGLYQPQTPCCLYATGYRYFLNTSSHWMPVREASLSRPTVHEVP